MSAGEGTIIEEVVKRVRAGLWWGDCDNGRKENVEALKDGGIWVDGGMEEISDGGLKDAGLILFW